MKRWIVFLVASLFAACALDRSPDLGRVSFSSTECGTGEAGQTSSPRITVMVNGQSNADGTGTRVNPDPTPSQQSAVPFYLNGILEPFRSGCDSNPGNLVLCGPTNHKEGIEIQLGLTLIQRPGAIVTMAKAAQSGTALWNALPAQYWPFLGYVSGGSYNAALQASIHALGAATQSGDTITDVLLQGEQESRSTVAVANGFGQVVLPQFMAYVRGLEPARHFHFVIVLTNQHLDPVLYQQLTTVRGYEVSDCAADSDCVSVDPVENPGNSPHYSAQQYEDIGQFEVAPLVP